MNRMGQAPAGLGRMHRQAVLVDRIKFFPIRTIAVRQVLAHDAIARFNRASILASNLLKSTGLVS